MKEPDNAEHSLGRIGLDWGFKLKFRIVEIDLLLLEKSSKRGE